MILTPFPEPPAGLQHALRMLAVRTHGTEQEKAALGDATAPELPWEPGSCSHALRADIWRWCDQVAGWVNRDYAWRPQQMIPSCWPRHRPIARELPVLAMLRWDAQRATDPRALEEWHRHTLPGFHERMLDRLGDSSCRAGRHQEWPAAARHGAHTEPSAARERAQLLLADTSGPGGSPRTGQDQR